MDFSWLIVVLLLCAMEGVERLQDDDIVLGRTLWAPWHHKSTLHLAGGWHVILSAPLFSDWVVIRGRDTASALPCRIGSRVRPSLASEAIALAMKLLGLLTISILAYLFPASVEAAGALGLVLGFCVLICWTTGLGALQSLSSWMIARDFTPHSSGRRIRFSSPFALPSRSQKLFFHAADLLGPVATARAFLDTPELLSLVRRSEWDRASGLTLGPTMSLLGESLTPEERTRLQLPPVHALGDEKYCPRCAATFLAWAQVCSSCSVSLLSADSVPSLTSSLRSSSAGPSEHAF